MHLFVNYFMLSQQQVPVNSSMKHMLHICTKHFVLKYIDLFLETFKQNKKFSTEGIPN